MATEFELIERYFSRRAQTARIGVGDDAAVVAAAPGCELVMTTDMLVSGTHFFPDVDPAALGHKSLAVNLSDLAAMGAQPRWVLLAMSLPQADEAWLSQFANGFYDLADRFDVDLIGGDTTRGPLSIAVTAIGEAATGSALLRDGAVVGDEVWVSGQVGSAALALLHIKGDIRLKGMALEQCMTRLHTPVPRVELGHELVGIATAAIDISDGLVADAGHVASRSEAGIELMLAAVPCLAELMHLKGDAHVRQALLAGGDDYELLFTAAPRDAARVDALSARLGLGLTRVGRVVQGEGVVVRDERGVVVEVPLKGYDHFG